MSGAALAICPECGEEIGRLRAMTMHGTLLNLPLPRSCPVCGAILSVRDRTASRYVDKHQRTLGVAWHEPGRE